MDYTEFSSGDFICDEYFQDWIIRPNHQTENFWNNWLSQHPEKREAVEEAKAVLLNITFKEHIPTEEQVQNSLASTLSIIHSLDEQSEGKSTVSILFPGFKQILKIAAIFIVAISTGIIIYYTYWNAKTTVSTKYGEVKKMVLPDGSQVVLNAHTTISYFTHVKKSRPRQVWLDGEAFFNVKHINKNKQDIKTSERFIVSTNNLNVNVLGTSFNVKQRLQKTEVVLTTGKIEIDFDKTSQPPVTMQPGNMIVYNNNSRPALKSVDPALYTSWMEKKLILKEASVNEIVQYIRDYYGYKVILEDTTLGNRKMEGVLLMDNIKDMLFVLSSTLNVKIEKQENTLIFEKVK